MDPLLVVSPHLDDAALGAGQFIQSWPGATVATVFAGTPDGGSCTSYDRDSGFANGKQAMAARRREDLTAMDVLHAKPVHLPLLDSQYRGNVPVEMGEVADVVEQLVVEVQPVKLLTVLGMQHPDHLVVHAACLEVAHTRRLELVVWEELPHRVQWPELAVDTARGLPGAELVFMGAGPLAAKQRAVGCYRSQLWALQLRCCWVPERFWRVTSG